MIVDHSQQQRRLAALRAHSEAFSRAALAQARAHETKTAAAWRAYRARVAELDQALQAVQALNH